MDTELNADCNYDEKWYELNTSSSIYTIFRSYRSNAHCSRSNEAEQFRDGFWLSTLIWDQAFASQTSAIKFMGQQGQTCELTVISI